MNRWLSDIEDAPIVSCYDDPQPTPQEWVCGCVTATYITDRDGLRGGRPFEMRLVDRCQSSRCRVRRALLDGLLHREDLLSSRDWPWTTDALLTANAALMGEQQRG
jgi:hypothetical protein